MGKHDKNDTTKKIAIGAAIAATAGYVAGILTAPKSGRETRGDIKNAAAKAVEEAENQLHKLHGELDDLVDQVKDKKDELSGRSRRELDDLLEKARDSKQRARDALETLKKDKVGDKDLKKAIGDATKAIEHLRDYLSK